MTMPAYPTGPYHGQPYRPVKSLDVLQTLALASAAMLALANVAGSLGFLAVMGDYRAAAREGRAASDVVTWVDVVALTLFPALIFAYVANCLWLSRARANTLGLGGDPEAHARSEAWVWLGWWVPIVSLWFPYQVVRDVWKESRASGRDGASLGAWWAAWLLGTFAVQVAGSLQTSESPLSQGAVDAIAVISAAGAGLTLIGLLLWVRIVLKIGAAQRQRAALQGIVMT